MELTAAQGVTVNAGDSLTICAQSEGENTGALTVTNTVTYAAAIGGLNAACGMVTICGGRITANADASAPLGETVVVTVAAEGEGKLTYQWYYRSAGAEKWSKSIYTGDSYTLNMTAARDGREVCCVVTDRYGYTVTTRVATLTMEP